MPEGELIYCTRPGCDYRCWSTSEIGIGERNEGYRQREKGFRLCGRGEGSCGRFRGWVIVDVFSLLRTA